MEDTKMIKKLKENINNLTKELKKVSDRLDSILNREEELLDVRNDAHNFVDSLYENQEEEQKEKYIQEEIERLKYGLVPLERQEKFKLNELSKFIEILEIGKFDKQKFNRFIRECDVPKPEQKSKNQFLYNKEHIPYAILFQLFKTLDLNSLSVLVDLINRNYSDNLDDIYTIFSRYSQDNLVFEKNISYISIDTYINYKVYIKTLLKDVKTYINDEFDKLEVYYNENIDDQDSDKIDFKINLLINKLLVGELFNSFSVDMNSSVIDDMINFHE